MTSNTFSTWECTSCWVRNPMKEKKCMACETLHPNTDVNSGMRFIKITIFFVKFNNWKTLGEIRLLKYA